MIHFTNLLHLICFCALVQFHWPCVLLLKFILTGYIYIDIFDYIMFFLQGLLVTFRSMSGEPVNNPLIRVAKRQHHGKKQPILVLFTDDGRPRQPPTFPTPGRCQVIYFHYYSADVHLKIKKTIHSWHLNS